MKHSILHQAPITPGQAARGVPAVLGTFGRISLTCGNTALVMRGGGWLGVSACWRARRTRWSGRFQGAGGLGDGGAVGNEAAKRGDLGRGGH